MPKRWTVRSRDAKRWTTLAMTTALLLTLSCLADQDTGQQTDEQTDQQTGSSASTCEAPASWFPQSQTPEPDPTTIPVQFCDFHSYAWQSFLWLTAEADDVLRFEAFPTSQDAIDGEDSPSGTEDSDGLLRLSARAGKADAPLDSVNQANENGILVDQSGRAVYYSQQLNDQMLNDIVSQDWNNPTTLNEIDPTTEFARGDIELKSAWKIVQKGEDTSDYFVREALIDRLVNVGGNIQVDSENPIKAQVALVGLHVVSFISDHPEAIWAAFEHRNNAPDMASDQSASKAVSDRDWTFYKAGTQALDCNQLNTSTLKLDESSQTLSPVTQVCRQYAYGMGPNDNSANLDAIVSLNESVQSQLPEDSITRNYFEVGAIWLAAGSLEPGSTLQSSLAGSTYLGSSVIETFNQANAAENNCFSCHNTAMYYPDESGIKPLQGTNLNLSHIILEAYVDNSPEPQTSQRGANQ